MTLISRAADCSIRTFVSCKFDRRFSALIIDGEPTEIELLEAFDSIETEYNDLIGSVPMQLRKMNEVNRQILRNEAVKLHMFAISEIVRRIFDTVPAYAMMADEADIHLARPIAAVQDLIEKLRPFGVKIKWTKDIEQFKKSINKAATLEKTQIVKLKELKSELETVEAQVTTSPKHTRADFAKLKIAVQSMLGYNISEIETNMYDYGIMCNSYLEMVKNQSPN
jgi:hypothetical protein